MTKAITAFALCMALLTGLTTTATAGEWAPGNDKLTPVKADHVASSECAFSGRDEPDDGAAGSDPVTFPDDGLWAQTPAKGKVQSPGQLIAIGFATPGTPGQACRGN